MRNPAEWAKEKRILPPGEAEPGPYRPERTPYLNEIAKAVVDPRYRRIVIVKGSQMGMSEFAINCVGQKLDDNPTPILYVCPTQRLVETISTNRVGKMLYSVPSLNAKLAKGKKDKISEKYIGGVRLGFGWAGSATELSSHPAGFVVVDERDRMPNDVRGEGDPVDLVDARGTTFADFKLLIISTPTIEGASAIWALFEEGTGFKWHIPCPICGEYFIPELKLLKWKEVGKELRNVHVECPLCEGHIYDQHRLPMNARGGYAAEGQQISPDGEVAGDIPSNKTASFWVSGLCSAWRSYYNAAENFLKAVRSGHPTRIQAAINTIFGETWRMRGEAPAAREVEELVGGYRSGDLPDDAKLLTMGVDVQKDCLYYEIRAWGYRGESWTIEVDILFGDTEKDEVWELLDEVRNEVREVGGRRFHLRLTGVDYAYRPHRVWNYTHRKPACVPVHGHGSISAPIRASNVEVKIRQGKRSVKNPTVKLFSFDDFYFKSMVHSKVRRGGYSGPGAWHLPEDTPEEFFKQIVAEELVTKATGKQEWIKNYKHNHWLDCAKINEVLGQMLKVTKIKEGKGESKTPVILQEGVKI